MELHQAALRLSLGSIPSTGRMQLFGCLEHFMAFLIEYFASAVQRSFLCVFFMDCDHRLSSVHIDA